MINTIRNKFFKLLGIKTTEQVKVYWSLLLVFTCGALQCYISSFPIALFLTTYGSETLPQIYLAVAGISILVGVIYTFFEYRLSFSHLILGLTFTIGLFLTLLPLGIISWGSPWIVVLLLVWATLSFDLLDLGIWSILNRIYTLQQAKSSFGIIGGFQSLGGLTGGLLSPILVMFLDLKYLLLLIGIFTFVVLCIMFFLLRGSSTQNEENIEEDGNTEVVNIDEQLRFKSIFKNRYVLKIFSLVALGVFAMYTIDLLFNTAAEARYTSEESLAGFLGVFFGLVDGLDLCSSVFVFSWLLKRFGLVSALFVLPTISLFIITPLLVFLQIPGFLIVIFWLIVVLKLFEECLRGSLTDMSMLLLLQPFQPRVRSFLQSKSDSIIVGASTAIISLILIGITATIVVEYWVLAVLALVFYVGQLLINITLKNNYIDALSKAIAKRYYSRGGTLRPTREDLLLLKKYLNSKHPDEIIYALQVIEKIDLKDFISALKLTLESTNNTLLEFTLDKIKQYHLTQYDTDLEKLLNECPEEKIQAKALVTLAANDYAKIKPLLPRLLIKPESSLGVAALTIIDHYESDQADKPQVFENLSSMTLSTNSLARLQAARLIGILNHNEFLPLLKQLIEDEDLQVRAQAFLSAIKLGQEELFTAVCNNVHLLPINQEMLADLKNHASIITSLIQDLFPGQPQAIKIKYLHVLEFMNTSDAQNYIKKVSLIEHGAVKKLALSMLVNMKLAYDETFYLELSKQIVAEVNYLQNEYNHLIAIPQNELTTLLYDVIHRKIKFSIERLLLKLAVYYDKTTINKVRAGFEKPGEDDRSYAIELLDSTLEAAHKKVIAPLFTNLYLAEPNPQQDMNSLAFVAVLKAYLRPKNNDNIHIVTTLASIYIVMNGGYSSLADELNALREHPSLAIQEALERYK